MFGKKNSDISHAIEVVRAVAAGDFNSRITNISTTGELGELLHGINDLIDRNDTYLRESVACLEKVSENRYFRKIVEVSMVGNFLTAARTVNSALDAMQSRASDFSGIADKFEDSVVAIVNAVSSSARSEERPAGRECRCMAWLWR